MLQLLPIIILVLMLLVYHITFKIKNPFWSHQPVVHNHSYFLKWSSPRIICDDFYISKFMNPIQIVTVKWKDLNHTFT